MPPSWWNLMAASARPPTRCSTSWGTSLWTVAVSPRGPASKELCKGNDFVCRASLHSFCRATGKHPTRGAVVPHTLVGVTPGSAAAAGGQVAFRAPGVCPAPPLWLWAQCSLASFPGVRVKSHVFYPVALRTVGCCVLFCFRRPAAHWVLRDVAGWFGLCSCASILCCWSALVGRLSVLQRTGMDVCKICHSRPW